MSTVWNVRVLEVAGDRARLALTLAHPDAGRFPRSPQFALRLLFDEARGLDGNFEEVARGPLGDALTRAEVHDEGFMRTGAARFVAAVDVTDVAHAPFDETAAHRAVDDKVRAQGIAQGGPEWDEAWDAAWRAWWKDPANLPSAVYTIRVTDPRWLGHLAPSQTWRSAAYCYDGPFV